MNEVAGHDTNPPLLFLASKAATFKLLNGQQVLTTVLPAVKDQNLSETRHSLPHATLRLAM
jgi:hypothetical protein